MSINFPLKMLQKKINRYPVLNIYQSEGFSGIEHFYYNDAIQVCPR